MKSIPAIFILFGLLLPLKGGEEISITSATKTTITRSGDFDDAGKLLENWLRTYLIRVLRTPVPETDAEKTLDIILRAENKSWHEMDSENINEADSFSITVSRHDNKAMVEIKGATVLATGFGIVKFIENYLGVAWLFPGDLGTVIPVKNVIRLPTGTVSYKPAFQSRMLSGLVYRADNLPPEVLALRGVAYQHRGFFWSNDYCRSLMLNYLAGFHHNMINIFPIEATRRLYPEVFPLHKGKRLSPDPKKRSMGNGYFWHPCYSNPTTVKVAVESAEKAFAAGSFMFSLGINDGLKVRCECTECMKTGWPESYYAFVRKVADKLRKEFPARYVGVLCYGDVVVPPEKAMPANVALVLTRLPQQNYHPWLDKSGYLGLYQYVYGSGYLVPNLPWEAIEYNARIMAEGRFRSYYAEVYPLWAFDAPKIYVLSRLLWNPTSSIDCLLLEYCRKAFGGGAEAMAEFFKQWQFFGKIDGKYGFARTWDHPAWRNSTAQLARISGETIEASDRLIEKAKSETGDKNDLARVNMVDCFYQHAKTLWQIYRLREKVFTPQSSESWNTILQTLLALEHDRAEYLKFMEKHQEWFSGSQLVMNDITDNKIVAFGRWSLDAEWLYAVLTCLWRLDGNVGALTLPPGVPNLFGNTLLASSAVTTHVRSYLPLDSGAEQLVAMNCSKAGGALVFSTVEEDFTWQCMSAIAKDIPLNETTFHRHNLSLTGKDGEAIIEVLLIANGITRKVASLVNRCDGRQSTQQREFIIQPAWLERGTRRLSRDYPPGAICQYKLNVIWKPYKQGATLNGKWRIENLSYATSVEQFEAGEK